MPVKEGITRIEAEVSGNVLASPTGAIIATGIVAAATRDPGGVPTTELRAGLVLSRLGDGTLREFGAGLTQVTAEAVGTGNGTIRDFNLARGRILPFSESVSVAGVVQGRHLYEIDYSAGVVRMKAAPANGAAVTASYLHIPFTAGNHVPDGTEVPYCILADPITLLDVGGVARNTSGRILLGGQIRPEVLVFARAGTATYARIYLSRHGFVGLSEVDF